MGETIGFDQFRRMAADHFGLEYDKVTRDVSFLGDLGIDSLSLINFIVKLEKKFGIKIELESVWSLANIGEAYDAFAGRIDPSHASSSAVARATDAEAE